jgi:hypothetical protein
VIEIELKPGADDGGEKEEPKCLKKLKSGIFRRFHGCGLCILWEKTTREKKKKKNKK